MLYNMLHLIYFMEVGMKKGKNLFSILALLLGLSLASCSSGATPVAVEDKPAVEEAAFPTEEAPTEVIEEAPATKEAPAENETATIEFPLPEDVENIDDLGDGAINFQTSLSLPDAVTFYRFAFIDLGYTEREINTAITDTTFSLVFDGHESGKAIVVQGVDLDGSVNINIRFEDM